MIDREDAMLIASRAPEAAILERGLRRHLSTPTRMLVAVSGGVDSTALLLLAAAVVRRRGVTHELVVGHVDHGLRAEGPQEAKAVESIANRLGLPFRSRRLEIAGACSAAVLRTHRWDALEAMATSDDASVVLTGHHALDQAETLVLRLARGTGLAGLSGIPESRRTPGGLLVLRPLLEATRTGLERLVQAVDISPVEDPTNARCDLARGLVRHEIMPRLERLHPGAARRMAATAREIAGIDLGAHPEMSGGWARTACRLMGESDTATQMRAAVRARVGPEADGVARTVWHSVARAVVDEQVQPRTIDVLPGCRVEIDADTVRLAFEITESTT